MNAEHSNLNTTPGTCSYRNSASRRDFQRVLNSDDVYSEGKKYLQERYIRERPQGNRKPNKNTTRYINSQIRREKFRKQASDITMEDLAESLQRQLFPGIRSAQDAQDKMEADQTSRSEKKSLATRTIFFKELTSINFIVLDFITLENTAYNLNSIIHILYSTVNFNNRKQIVIDSEHRQPQFQLLKREQTSICNKYLHLLSSYIIHGEYVIKSANKDEKKETKRKKRKKRILSSGFKAVTDLVLDMQPSAHLDKQEKYTTIRTTIPHIKTEVTIPAKYNIGKRNKQSPRNICIADVNTPVYRGKYGSDDRKLLPNISEAQRRTFIVNSNIQLVHCDTSRFMSLRMKSGQKISLLESQIDCLARTLFCEKGRHCTPGTKIYKALGLEEGVPWINETRRTIYRDRAKTEICHRASTIT